MEVLFEDEEYDRFFKQNTQGTMLCTKHCISTGQL